MNRVKKTIVFTLLLLIFIFSAQELLLAKSSDESLLRIKHFYNKPVNSMDVIFFGASHCCFGVNPNLIWKEAGVPAYNLAQPAQPLWMTYHYMIEALKYQKPKVVFLETRYLYVLNGEEYDVEDGPSHSISGMKMSFNKLQIIQAGVRPNERAGYLFPITTHHGAWKTVLKSFFDKTPDEIKKSDLYKGYWLNTKVLPFKDVPIKHTDEIGEIKGKTLKYFQKILKVTKENKIKLVLFKVPYPEGLSNLEEQKMDNRAAQIAKELGTDFINLNNEISTLGIDWETDMMDPDHMNKKGADKVSKYLTQYIKDNMERFELQDKRKDESYDSWNRSCDLYFEVSEKQDGT